MRLKAVFLGLIGLLSGLSASADPPWIFGMHDPGGEAVAEQAGKRAWILITEALGADPNDQRSSDYSSYERAGHGVIVRLNFDYGPNGTLPVQAKYADFAKRVGNFVRNSKGAHFWVIGNETNLPVEWPGQQSGEPITVARYVDAYTRCRAAILSQPGHEFDRVAVSPVGTFAPPFPAQGIPGFHDYFSQLMQLIGTNQDAIVLHAYTHGADPSSIFSDQKMNPPYQDIYYHFRVYRNYLSRVPANLKHLPVFITETDMSDNGVAAVPWPNVNNGWIKNLYQEVNTWNRTSGNQIIRAVCLYRWPSFDTYGISDKPNTIQDWREAMANDYRWDNIAPGKITGRVQSLGVTPVGGARITLYPGGKTTNAAQNGFFQFTDLPSDVYHLAVTKSGYKATIAKGIALNANQTVNRVITLAPDNSIIVNGDFESGFAPNGIALGWQPWNAPWSNAFTYSVSSEIVKSGSYAQQWGRSDDKRQAGGLMQAVTVEQGRPYELEGQARFTSSEPSAWIEIGYDLSGQLANGEAATIKYTKLESGGQNVWLPYKQRFTATGSSASIFLKFGQYNEGGVGPCYAWFDDLRLTPLNTVSGRVNLQGWVGPSLNGSMQGLSVKIELLDADTNQLREEFQSVPLSAQGDYLLATSYRGKSKLRVSRMGFLKTFSAPFLLEDSPAQIDLTLPAGDTNGDNTIDDFDLFNLTSEFGGSSSGGFGFTDLNGDSSVDDFDLFLLTGNFLQSGA